MRRLHLTVAALGLALLAAARADSIQFGASFLCSKDPQVFELAAVVDHNHDTTSVSEWSKDATRLKYGTHRLHCNVSGRKVAMIVHVNPPMNGHCMGGGHATISSFRIGATSVPLDLDTRWFNYNCLGKVKVRIAVKPDGMNTVIESCSSDVWTWGNGYSAFVCSQQVIK